MFGRDDTPEKKAANRILQECSRDRDELVREFCEWRIRAPWQMGLDDAIETWASKRWPTPVPGAALGILHAAAQRAEIHGPVDEENAIVPPRNLNEPTLEYLERIAVTNGWMKRGEEKPARPMPEVRLPYREPGQEG